jgi:hypothetical protein
VTLPSNFEVQGIPVKRLQSASCAEQKANESTAGAASGLVFANPALQIPPPVMHLACPLLILSNTSDPWLQAPPLAWGALLANNSQREKGHGQQ